MSRPTETAEPTPWECFMAAVQFLTRVSIPNSRSMSAEHYAMALRCGVKYFPIVGGCIGVFTSLALVGLECVLPVWIAALVAIGCEAILTGAFHEDAFADTCDSLGGGWTREQVLEIMKDSRLGTYGTLGLIIGTGIRVSCCVALFEFGWPWAMASVVASSALSRVAMVGLMATTEPITDRPSQARDVSGTQTWQTVRASLAMAIPFWIAWLWLAPMLAVLTITFATALLIGYRRTILRRVGGTTGDLLGCSAYLSQVTILMGSSWCLG